jgi:hypothetical protein
MSRFLISSLNSSALIPWLRYVYAVDKLRSGWCTESMILAFTGSWELSAVLILKIVLAATPAGSGAWMWMKIWQSSFWLKFVGIVISRSVIGYIFLMKKISTDFGVLLSQIVGYTSQLIDYYFITACDSCL